MISEQADFSPRGHTSLNTGRRAILISAGSIEMSIFCVVDDKHVPLYRVMWVSRRRIFAAPTTASAKGNTKSAWNRGNRCGPSSRSATTCCRRWKPGKAAWGRPGRWSVAASTKSRRLSTFEREGYKWRETYFVLFDSCKRPNLEERGTHPAQLSDRFELTNASADEDGRFESITRISPDDYAALGHLLQAGEEVTGTRRRAFTRSSRAAAADADERAKLARLAKCDARFDLLHFEQTSEDDRRRGGSRRNASTPARS